MSNNDKNKTSVLDLDAHCRSFAPACSSASIQCCKTVVNHVSPRLADGRLGSAPPALWVCLRQMGLCIHLLAPCLPTVRSAQVSRGAHAACPDLSTPQGLSFQLLFPTRCWMCSCADSISSSRGFAQDWTRETFSHCAPVTTPGPISAQCAQVDAARPHGDRPQAAPGFSVAVIDLNLDAKVSDQLELVCSMTCGVGPEVIFGKL